MLSALSTVALAADIPGPILNKIPSAQTISRPPAITSDQPFYYWKTISVDGTAELVTLFCHACGNPSSGPGSSDVIVPTSDADVPLVSVLRDTLGDQNAQNDRILYVWLLSYVHPNLGQHILSAMPFLYWRLGDGSGKSPHSIAPLLNLSTPERSLVADIGREFLQWSVLDPSMTPIRATSRAYRGNESDYERLRLEETAAYLRRAPVAVNNNGLSKGEIDSVLGRIELRKRLLGGLFAGKHDAHLGAEAEYAQERVRSRNWEVLRQCAERTGLLFEPIQLAGGSAKYGILWYQPGAAPPAKGTSLKSVWKILNLRNPWTDRRLRNWYGPEYTRAFDENGLLLPEGATGATRARLIPLALYSFDYPTAPLLLVDFRGGLHIRRHEMTQRAINDVTAGVIGISHFTNWYYYVAADLYDFVVSRHGAATNEAARLDCYSQFRAALGIDKQLNPELREQMQRRISSLTFNPLEGSPAKALQLAHMHYQVLLAEIQGGKLLTRIDKERRGELANFGASGRVRLTRIVMHDATFGAYTCRAKKDGENLVRLDHERRILYQLNFLDSLAEAGTPPEVAYTADRIHAAISEVNDLIPLIRSSAIRSHAMRTLQELQGISQSPELQAHCADALAALKDLRQPPVQVANGMQARPTTGMMALVSATSRENAR